jgi:hypothetical protein
MQVILCPSFMTSIRVVLAYMTGMIVSVLPEKLGFQLMFNADDLPSRPDL